MQLSLQDAQSRRAKRKWRSQPRQGEKGQNCSHSTQLIEKQHLYAAKILRQRNTKPRKSTDNG